MSAILDPVDLSAPIPTTPDVPADMVLAVCVNAATVLADVAPEALKAGSRPRSLALALDKVVREATRCAGGSPTVPAPRGAPAIVVLRDFAAALRRLDAAISGAPGARCRHSLLAEVRAVRAGIVDLVADPTPARDTGGDRH